MDETTQTGRIVTVVQTQMNSRRLPGKPLLPLGDSTVLEQLTARIRASDYDENLVIAASDDASDDALRNFCDLHDLPYFAGSLEDPLDRVLQAAQSLDAALVVRCTLNNVLLVPRMLNACVRYALDTEMDYVCVQRLPIGVTVEALPIRTLTRLAEQATDDVDRRLVTSFVRNHRDQFETAFLPAPPRMARPDLRLALQTQEDYLAMANLFADVPAQADGLIAIEDALAYAERHLTNSQFDFILRSTWQAA